MGLIRERLEAYEKHLQEESKKLSRIISNLPINEYLSYRYFEIVLYGKDICSVRFDEEMESYQRAWEPIQEEQIQAARKGAARRRI